MKPFKPVEDYEETINTHYGKPGLDARILAALYAAGRDLGSLTREHMRGFDEFHFGGVEGTRSLARLAGLQAGTHVLDAGCGLGGPARTLAAEFGCTVIGLDLTKDFCLAAEMLTLRLGLSGKVSFRRGNVLELPFDDATFDVVWLQHVAMNVPDKLRLFEQAGRVLKPGGTLALLTVLACAVEPIHYPVIWAIKPEEDFFESEGAFRKPIATNGFKEVAWQESMHQEFVGTGATAALIGGNELPPLSQALYVDNLAEKGRNLLGNLEESRIAMVQAVFRKEESSGGVR